MVERDTVKESELAELDYGTTTLMLGIELPGANRQDCVPLDLEAVKVLRDLLTKLIPRESSGVVVAFDRPAIHRSEGLRLMASWCDGALAWAKDKEQ